MRAFGRAVMVRVPMSLSRFLFGVVSTKGTYGMLVPMNSLMYKCYHLSEGCVVHYCITCCNIDSLRI